MAGRFYLRIIYCTPLSIPCVLGYQAVANPSTPRCGELLHIVWRIVTVAHFVSPLKSAPAVVDYILGGWQINGIATLQTGQPLQISNGGNNTNLGSPGQRPNNNGKSAKVEGPIENRLDHYFDQSVFSQAGNFTFGNTSRTSPDLREPGTRAFDASIFKRFRIRESGSVEFRAEGFNFFNHPLWNPPGTTVTAPGSFGVVTSKGGQRRQFQLALRIGF